jgi:hypothetical protein
MGGEAAAAAAVAEEEEEAKAARAFYAEHGYVVFHGALSAERCAGSRAEIWGSLEESTPVRQAFPSLAVHCD